MTLGHPLRFERIFLEKVWGGRALERTPGIELPPEIRVGETWEVVDRDAERSIVSDGPFAGKTLGELVHEHGRELLGASRPTPEGRFPLLVKYIDASENLSIQVHPDKAAAARIGGTSEGKTEAWYILAAEPGSVVWCGLKAGVTREELAEHANEPGVETMLARWEVRPGDCITVPGGTVHAIGAGVTLLEVQQNSDTTYRIYDWGRVGLDGNPRETHLEQALEVAAFGEKPRPPVRDSEPDDAQAESSRVRLSHTDHFAIDVLEVRGRAELSTAGRFAVYSVVSGSGSLELDGREHTLRSGDTLLLPASTPAHVVAGDSLTLVVSTDGGER